MFRQPPSAGQSIAVTAGHWTNEIDQTGCTVVLFDRPAPAVIDIRGGAPGTRETAVLGDDDLVQAVDAILLTGGSAYGLGAADGVMRFLRERGRGVTTPAGSVPIVPTAVIFDLAVGNAAWPTPDSGYEAAAAAGSMDQLARGRVGVGRGATTGKLRRDRAPVPGGIGLGHCPMPGGGLVTATSVVNAAGTVILDDGDGDPREAILAAMAPMPERTATTLSVVLVNAPCDRRALARVAIAAHDGMARRIMPCHTIFDGDIVFAVGLQSGDTVPSSVLSYGIATELAVERAIVDAIQQSTPEPTGASSPT